jgi:hypothetical protein
VFPDNGAALDNWFWARSVARVDNPMDISSLHENMFNDPTGLSMRGIHTPYFQFSQEGFKAYPGFYLSDSSRSARVKLGSNWIA